MKLPSAFAAAAAALLVAGAAHAASYSATTSFNGTSKGGAFTYGTSTGDFENAGTFTGFGTTSLSCAGNANFICANDGSLVPGIGKVLDGGQASFQTVVVPSGTLWVHPGTDVESEIVFTAPISGMYGLSAEVGRLDTSSNGNGVDAFFQGLFGTRVYPDYPYGVDSAGTLSTTISLLAGQQVAFAVNNRGEYTYDSTAVNFLVNGPDAISAAPEPGTWALMFAGVAMMGAMLRRRRQGDALAV